MLQGPNGNLTGCNLQQPVSRANNCFTLTSTRTPAVARPHNQQTGGEAEHKCTDLVTFVSTPLSWLPCVHRERAPFSHPNHVSTKSLVLRPHLASNPVPTQMQQLCQSRNLGLKKARSAGQVRVLVLDEMAHSLSRPAPNHDASTGSKTSPGPNLGHNPGPACNPSPGLRRMLTGGLCMYAVSASQNRRWKYGLLHIIIYNCK